jgi:glycosyltransferase involved in cell wall biosynthesis
MANNKIKVLTISDHPLSPSGVGTQTKYFIEGLLKTGKYEFVSLGGAIKHHNYQPVRIEEWGEDWKIYPIDGYGNPDVVRTTIRSHKPDILWFMTDPRFWHWLWQMEDEIRPLMPTIYYHVWDNFPLPLFNRQWYESTDVIASISKVTNQCVAGVFPESDLVHIPHAVNTDIFKKHNEEDILEFRKNSMQQDPDCKKTIFFWNNRNARRKQSGTLIFWFKEFLDRVGSDKAMLIMHTDPKDPNGQDLNAIIHSLGLVNGEVVLSTQKMPAQNLSLMYNMADCTINISDAEGFGLSTLESLACETPIVVTMTGGLQEQVTDGERWFGYGIEPSSKAIIGSQQIPFIFEDRLNKDEFIETLIKFCELPKEERQKMGTEGREHVMKNYNFENFNQNWENLMDRVHEQYGSWDTRKGYKVWREEEL